MTNMVSNRKHNSIKFAFLNVGGLQSQDSFKTSDPTFMNIINKYDIVFLAETHIGSGLE